MTRMHKSHGAAEERWLVEEDADRRSADAAARRQAAAYLREARLTDNPMQREELRRMAAELLAPTRRPRNARPQEPR